MPGGPRAQPGPRNTEYGECFPNHYAHGPTDLELEALVFTAPCQPRLTLRAAAGAGGKPRPVAAGVAERAGIEEDRPDRGAQDEDAV